MIQRTKNLNFMKIFIIAFLFLILFSCNASKSSDGITYSIFCIVEEDFDTPTEKPILKRGREKLTPTEIESLASFLERNNYMYKVTKDSLILIATHKIRNLNELNAVNIAWEH